MIELNWDRLSNREFEERIGNLTGIEKNFSVGTLITISLTGGSLRIVELVNDKPQLISAAKADVDLETALVNLDKICLGQKVPHSKYFTGAEIATKGNNIEQWLRSRGDITIYPNRFGQRLIKFEDKIHSYHFGVEVNMQKEPISKILSFANSTIAPVLFDKQIEIYHS